ncbi:4Fe-4S binding protein [Candidatus Bipolaricaulota bacterium]
MSTVTQVDCAPKQALDALRAFAADGMCGRCIPCPIATRQSIAMLERITEGHGEDVDLARLARVSTELVDAARCPKGEEAARKLGEALASGEFARHVDGICGPGTCAALARYHVIPDRCTMCGACQEACPRDAIEGDPYIAYRADNRPYVIRLEKCDGCGKCVAVCSADAIERVT